jgi:hypothetical protein
VTPLTSLNVNVVEPSLPEEIVGVTSTTPVPSDAVIDYVLINVPCPEAILIELPDVSNTCFAT